MGEFLQLIYVYVEKRLLEDKDRETSIWTIVIIQRRDKGALDHSGDKM
jgi:hypothetical protein